MPLPSNLAATPIQTTEVLSGGASLAQGVLNRAINDIQTYVNTKSNFPPTVQLTNQSGVTVADGDVVVLDAATDAGFVRTTTVGDLRPVFVVRDATIANLAAGQVQYVGTVTLAVQAAVTRGNYLRCSATAGKAEDAGANLVDGVFAKAATGFAGPGAGTVTAVLFGATNKAASAASVNLHGQCQLVKSGANLVLQRFNGNQLIINGTAQTVPSGGVTLAPTGLVASQLYYIYAWMNAGNMTLEASTTGHATHTDGVEIKSADATRTLVGMARTDGSVQWQDTPTQRFVLSWFGRQYRQAHTGLGANKTTTSGTFAELDSTARIEFLSWGAEAVEAGYAGIASNNTGTAGLYTTLGLDGTAQDVVTGLQVPTAGLQTPCGGHIALSVSEGYHYLTLMGFVGSGTGTWLGGTSAGTRCNLSCAVMG